MEYDFDGDWGDYDKEKQIDQQMHTLIEKNTNDVCHYFQQFGLGINCVKEELRELTLFSNEESPKDGLADP